MTIEDKKEDKPIRDCLPPLGLSSVMKLNNMELQSRIRSCCGFELSDEEYQSIFGTNEYRKYKAYKNVSYWKDLEAMVSVNGLTKKSLTYAIDAIEKFSQYPNRLRERMKVFDYFGKAFYWRRLEKKVKTRERFINTCKEITRQAGEDVLKSNFNMSNTASSLRLRKSMLKAMGNHSE